MSGYNEGSLKFFQEKLDKGDLEGNPAEEKSHNEVEAPLEPLTFGEDYNEQKAIDEARTVKPEANRIMVKVPGTEDHYFKYLDDDGKECGEWKDIYEGLDNMGNPYILKEYIKDSKGKFVDAESMSEDDYEHGLSEKEHESISSKRDNILKRVSDYRRMRRIETTKSDVVKAAPATAYEQNIRNMARKGNQH